MQEKINNRFLSSNFAGQRWWGDILEVFFLKKLSSIIKLSTAAFQKWTRNNISKKIRTWRINHDQLRTAEHYVWMVSDNDNYHRDELKRKISAEDHIAKEGGERSTVAAYHATISVVKKEERKTDHRQLGRGDEWVITLILWCCHETLTKMNLGRTGSIWLPFLCHTPSLLQVGTWR